MHNASMQRVDQLASTGSASANRGAISVMRLAITAAGRTAIAGTLTGSRAP